MNEPVVIVSPFARIIVDESMPPDLVFIGVAGSDLHAIKKGEHYVIPAREVQEIFDGVVAELFKKKYGLEWITTQGRG